MFLHLGGEAIVKKKDIVAIFDMDNTTGEQRISRKCTGQRHGNKCVGRTAEIVYCHKIRKRCEGIYFVYIAGNTA